MEKLNSSELVNQYVSVVETLLEEKKTLSHKLENTIAQLQEAQSAVSGGRLM